MEIPTVALFTNNQERNHAEIPNNESPLIEKRKKIPSEVDMCNNHRNHCKSGRQEPVDNKSSYVTMTTEDVEVEFEDDDEEPEGCARYVNEIQSQLGGYWSKYSNKIKKFFIFLCILAYFVYFISALLYKFDEGSITLIGITSFVVIIKAYPIITSILGPSVDKFYKPLFELITLHSSKINMLLLVCIYISVVIVIITDLTLYSSDFYNLVSLSGIFIYILLMFIFSVKPSKVKWRTVIWGFGLQFGFSLIILKWSGGYLIFKWFGDRVHDVLGFLNAGCLFMFGPSFKDHFFAMQVLPFVIFVSSLITILFYFGIMEWLILKLAWLMQASMGTTAGESVNAAGNIFVGQTESPLLVRPLLPSMTESEIHAMMTSGFASIAGGTLAAYMLFGVSPNHLLSASVMSAPAALAISKISFPETKKSLATAMNVKQLMQGSPEKSFIEAAASGACYAVPLVANIAASLIAFISILEGMNGILVWFGDRIGADQPITFQFLCSYALWPFALVMGVYTEDCRKVAELIGIKTIVNEFVAYESLSKLITNRRLLEEHVMNNGTWRWYKEDIILNHETGNSTILENGVIGDRSVVIATYALCGFSNFCSIGVQIGAFSTMMPTRKSVVAKIAVRAMIAGNVACFVTACIAGLFYNPIQ